MDWPTAAVEISKFLIPATVAGWASFKVAQIQLRNKEIELTGQAVIKAKELVFNAYQKKLEKLGEEFSNYGKNLAQVKHLILANEPETPSEKVGQLIAEFLNIFYLFKDDVEELKSELAEANLPEKYTEKMGKVETAILLLDRQIAMKNRNETDKKGAMNNLIHCMKHLETIKTKLIEKKSMDLFSDYLNTQKSNLPVVSKKSWMFWK